MSSRVNPLIVSSKVQFAKHSEISSLSAHPVALGEELSARIFSDRGTETLGIE